VVLQYVKLGEHGRVHLVDLAVHPVAVAGPVHQVRDVVPGSGVETALGSLETCVDSVEES
jgi:hypothetical protein